MTADPEGLRRLDQFEAEAEEDRDAWLQDWVARNLEYLSALNEPPWNDAGGPEDGKDGGEKDEAA